MTADVDTNVEDSEAAQSKITVCQISTAGTQDEEGKTVELTDEEKTGQKKTRLRPSLTKSMPRKTRQPQIWMPLPKRWTRT